MTFSLRCLESFICLHVAVVLGMLMVQSLEVQTQVILYQGHLPTHQGSFKSLHRGMVKEARKLTSPVNHSDTMGSTAGLVWTALITDEGLHSSHVLTRGNGLTCRVHTMTAAGSSLMGESRLFPVEDKGPSLELHHFTLYHPHLLALWFLGGTAFNYL